MGTYERQFETNSPEQTAGLAQRIGAMLQPGDTLMLDGPVGAGKTHFARSLIQSVLDEPEDIPSPTYTLVQIYETRIGEIWHCDLYRLTSAEEVVELGLDAAFDTAVCLIEWPDRLGDQAPADAVQLGFTVTDDRSRRIHVTGPEMVCGRLFGKVDCE
ncbi:tRNA (adenosine(37)-N6)-threonylcarbamoyltransferase complex ATPase subunit type 1 TsaE [Pseudooceanicola sp. C21-150M6]|uniref:tRNA (adenosine(37)-N6)-threonylcarbamoyltransferase complex ATPase subunit type 1 TsaE n=1 Tax=Pseudooceanicola sp. C21-150M6 TaxID=3434355 RepID=UPI003D7F9641